jgi:hypothetical protein
MRLLMSLALIASMLVACSGEMWGSPNDMRATGDAYYAGADDLIRQTQDAAVKQSQHETAQAADLTAQVIAKETMDAYSLNAQLTASHATETGAAQRTSDAKTQIAYEAAWLAVTQTVTAQIAQEARAQSKRNVTDVGWTVFWFLFATASALVGLWAIVRVVRVSTIRPVQRDGQGDLPLLVDPFGNAIDLGRSEHPGVSMGKGGVKVVVHPAPSDSQQAVNKLDQATRIARAAPSRTNDIMLSAGATAQPWKVYGPAQQPPEIPPDVLPILDAEWRELNE